jgi:hypothetical protein
MQVPSAAQLIEVWEQGARQHPVDRAVTLLAAAHPDMAHTEILALNIGARDARLLGLRERLFGRGLKSFAECPNCQTRLEFSIDANDLRKSFAGAAGSDSAELTMNGMQITFRPLNSADLQAAAPCETVTAARLVLLERCVIDARRNGEAVAAADLPDDCVQELSARMASLDDAADIAVDLECVACGHDWQMALDIVSFLWAEIQSLAKRYLDEVHTLAWAYGWREADILAMGPARRQFYLERVG